MPAWWARASTSSSSSTARTRTRATGPVLVVGSSATFTYEVRNTGNVSLATVIGHRRQRHAGQHGRRLHADASPAATPTPTPGSTWARSGPTAPSRPWWLGSTPTLATTTGTPVYPPGTNNPNFPPGTPVPGLTPPTDTDPANYLGQQRDFGDLPSPLYSSVLGAYHVFADQNLRMGAANTDAEAAAQPNATATGDDLAGAHAGRRDRRDAFRPRSPPGRARPSRSVRSTIPPVRPPRCTASSTGTATATSSTPMRRRARFLLAGFFGNETLTFSVPAGATTGQDLGARFRISTDTGLTAANNAHQRRGRGLPGAGRAAAARRTGQFRVGRPRRRRRAGRERARCMGHGVDGHPGRRRRRTR